MIVNEPSILRAAWADLIERYPWHHFATLTTPVPLSHEQLKHTFAGFVRRLEKRDIPIWWCSAIETGRIGGQLHLHVLLGGTEMLSGSSLYPSSAMLATEWEGRSKIGEFDSDRGAVHYMTKDVPSGEAEIDFCPNIQKHVRKWRQRKSEQARTNTRRATGFSRFSGV